jgi:hypothetical protein
LTEHVRGYSVPIVIFAVMLRVARSRSFSQVRGYSVPIVIFAVMLRVAR